MRTVYELTRPINDFEAAALEKSGKLVVPAFNCPYCGIQDSTTDVWYPSLQPQTPDALALWKEGLPSKVSSYKDYVQIRDRIRKAFQTKALLLPGSTIGSDPIDVPKKTYIGGLTQSKLKKGIDLIRSGMTNWIVSTKLLSLMKRINVKASFFPIELQTGNRTISSYHIIELEPRLVWTEAERSKYGVSVCAYCGSSYRRISKGMYTPKQFEGSVFRDGSIVALGFEERAVYINAALYDELAKLHLRGVAFRKAGEYV